MSNIYAEYTPPKSSGGYFKPEDSKSVRARIVSEPVIFDEEYQEKINTKYAVVIYNFDAGEVQVFKMPKTAFNMLVELGREEDWGDPLETPYDIKIKRSGKGKETIWTLTPSPAKDKLTEEQELSIEGTNIIKMISSGNGVTNIEWLRDVVANGGKRTQNTNTNDDDIDLDTPVDLSSIPF